MWEMSDKGNRTGANELNEETTINHQTGDQENATGIDFNHNLSEEQTGMEITPPRHNTRHH